MSEALGESQNQEGLPLKRYVSILFRYKLLIFCIFIFGSAIGIGGAFVFVPEQKVYDGYKKVVLRNPDTELGFITGNTNLSMEGSFFLEAEINRLRDMTVLEEVVRECKLEQDELDFHDRFIKTPRGKLTTWIKDRFGFFFGAETDPDFSKKAVQTLRKDLIIEPENDRRRGRSTQGVILSVQYSNEDSEKVKAVINAFVTENRLQRKKAYTGSGLLQKQKQLFTKKLNNIAIELNDARTELQTKYTGMNLPFNSDPSFLLAAETQNSMQIQTRLTQLAGEIERSKIQVEQYQKELDSVPDLIQPNTTPTVSNSPRAREVQSSIQTLEEERNSIKSRLLTSTLAEFQKKILTETLAQYNKELESLNKELAALSKTEEISSPESVRIKRALNHEKITYDFLLKEKNNQTERKTQQFEKENQLRSKILDLTVSRDKYNQLFNQHAEQEQIVDNFDIYEFARKDVEVLRDVTTSVILSNEPRSAHKITRMKVVLGAIFGSLAAGLGLAFLLGMVLDSAFHMPAEAEKTLGVRVIACVPQSRRKLLR